MKGEGVGEGEGEGEGEGRAGITARVTIREVPRGSCVNRRR